MSRIQKLYVSNLLTGLVFWYGIEKLFMRSIGIDGAGIGLVTAAILAVTILFDIPAGLLADRWSRKGLLIISGSCLMVCSLVCGTSHGLTGYIIGALFYGAYLVSTSGTYQAIIYDVLHEENKTQAYSKIMGRAYALFLCGAGIADIASGLIAHAGLRWPFLLSAIPPILNILLVATIHEPTFHKSMQKEKFLKQFKQDISVIAQVRVIRSLALVSCTLSIVSVFTLDFSQLYMLKFTHSSVVLGLLWALFAFALAAGSFVAHRAQARLSSVILAAMALVILMASARHAWTLIAFMLYAILNTAAAMLIETQVQHHTPSAVRASTLSFLSTLGRIVSLPAALLMGWLTKAHDVFWALRFVAIVAILTFLYWLLVGINRLKAQSVSQEVAVQE